MTSEKQILANRQNAQYSTGPQTEKGKKIVSKNAIKHGLFSKEIVVEEKESEVFADFYNALFAHLVPKNPLESVIAEKIIANAWRLRRVIGIESLFVNKESMDAIYHHSIMVQQQANQNIVTLSRYEQGLEKSLFRLLQVFKELQEGDS